MKLKLPKLPKVEMFGIDIVKNFLLFFLFFVIFLILLAFVVAPTIKKFKEIKQNYYITKMKADNVQAKLYKLTMQYKKSYKENHKVILAFKIDFNKEAFKIFSSKYMNVTNIEDKNSSTYQNKFVKKSYIVTATLKSPTSFYKFVDATKNTNNVLKVYYPVVFKAKNGDIKLLYKLEAFTEMK
jgi:predicted PurR-regulated permease PerM